jgi:hypothetical protein
VAELVGGQSADGRPQRLLDLVVGIEQELGSAHADPATPTPPAGTDAAPAEGGTAAAETLSSRSAPSGADALARSRVDGPMRTTRDTDRSAHPLAGPTILDDLDRNGGARRRVCTPAGTGSGSVAGLVTAKRTDHDPPP